MYLKVFKTVNVMVYMYVCRLTSLGMKQHDWPDGNVGANSSVLCM